MKRLWALPLVISMVACLLVNMNMAEMPWPLPFVFGLFGGALFVLIGVRR